MKNAIIITALGFLLVLNACKKESGTPAPQIENTWQYGSTSFTAAFSETNILYGYGITFRPGGANGLRYGMSLQFSQKPQSGTSYAVTNSRTPSASQVLVALDTGDSTIYYSAGTDSKIVETGMIEGKLTFSGSNIRMLRDTIPALADTLSLGFSLKEF